jgi:hypothetical protein
MSYCTSAQVRQNSLRGIDLSALGDATAQDAFIDALLPAVEHILNNEIGRDFYLHESDVVTLSGNNSHQLAIWRDDNTLCAPIIAINSVEVYDQVIDLTNLKINANHGIIGFQRPTADRLAVRRGLEVQLWTFPEDFENVTIDLDWGYEEVPADVSLAAQFIAAAFTMITVSGGISAGVRSKKIRDFEVTYGTSGPYSSQIRTWFDQAKILLQAYRTGRHSY